MFPYPVKRGRNWVMSGRATLLVSISEMFDRVSTLRGQVIPRSTHSLA